MKALVIAVADSIQAEVDGAADWTRNLFDPLWRNPVKGKTLNVYPNRRVPGSPQAHWTGTSHDVVEIFAEYAEPAPEQVRTLDRNQEAELDINDNADAIRLWALKHDGGFPPAWQLTWGGTDYVASVSRELGWRIVRVVLNFSVESQVP